MLTVRKAKQIVKKLRKDNIREFTDQLIVLKALLVLVSIFEEEEIGKITKGQMYLMEEIDFICDCIESTDIWEMYCDNNHTPDDYENSDVECGDEDEYLT
jgi:hypothetical protein